MERTHRVVIDATIALLAQGGSAAVSIEAVAARSGVAKSTIYRHWPGRAELINDALAELKPPTAVVIDGDVRDQIIGRLENLARYVAGSTWSMCLPALLDVAERDAEVREVQARLAREGRRSMVELLVEGVRRGELRPDLDAELVAEALAGPILLRRLFLAEPLDPARVRDLVDQVLPRLVVAIEAAG